ncbi:MAG: hypothetical protein Kow0037_19390 [Calditrichia bacterium]
MYLRSLFPTINNNQLVSLLSIFLLENYLQFGELEKAEILIQQILNDQQNSEAEVFALLKMLQIQLHIDDDIPGANQTYQTLKSRYSSHSFTTLAELELSCFQTGGAQLFAPKTQMRQNEKSVDLTTPVAFELSQNYPNPFNPGTRINFVLPSSSNSILKIYNVLGQVVKRYNLGYLSKGEHTILWNGTNDSGNPVSSGIYFYELRSGENQQLKKMFLLR